MHPNKKLCGSKFKNVSIYFRNAYKFILINTTLINCIVKAVKLGKSIFVQVIL